MARTRRDGWQGLASRASLILGTLASGCADVTGPGAGDGATLLGSGHGACQRMATAAGTTYRECIDYTGLTLDQEAGLRQACGGTVGGVPIGDSGVVFAVQGMFTPGRLCDRRGSFGGCQIIAGGFMQTYWHFPGNNLFSEAVLRASCIASGWRWIAP